jgi:hypothetical protein
MSHKLNYDDMNTVISRIPHKIQKLIYKVLEL